MSGGGARGEGRLLVLEPFYGGSHRAFLDGLATQLPGVMQLLTMPDRHWKARMRLAAPQLVAELQRRKLRGDEYRAILCSSYVDVAAFRGLLPPPWRSLPICTYFHENQFAYPVTTEAERDLHFAITNLTTALASDSLAFNSAYNRDSFLDGCRRMFARSADLRLAGAEEAILAKSVILSPGQDFAAIDAAPQAERDSAPVIVWNQRWEHDKNPEEFFAALFELVANDVDFRLVVLGESFRSTPVIFAEAKSRLAERIIHFGFAASPADYAAWLRRGDVVVSTAGHEFFGIAVIEAVRAGCRPLLPNRLAYPELFPDQYLYRSGELSGRLTAALRGGRLDDGEARGLTDRFAWPSLLDTYRDWLGIGA